jgi:cytochrome P450
MTPPYVTDREMSKEDGGRRLREYVTDLVARKRADGRGDDLLDALITAEENESGLTGAEVVALTQQLLFAGH